MIAKRVAVRHPLRLTIVSAAAAALLLLRRLATGLAAAVSASDCLSTADNPPASNQDGRAIGLDGAFEKGSAVATVGRTFFAF